MKAFNKIITLAKRCNQLTICNDRSESIVGHILAELDAIALAMIKEKEFERNNLYYNKFFVTVKQLDAELRFMKSEFYGEDL